MGPLQEKSPAPVLKFAISEFELSPLPPCVQKKWNIAAGLPKGEQRAAAIREARKALYTMGCSTTVRPRRGVFKLADMRNRAAAAAAAAVQQATEQTDSERSALLAARMLANMQAAEKRRLEAREVQRARLAAKSELVMARLAKSHDRQLRQQRAKPLRSRHDVEQLQTGEGFAELTPTFSSGQLKHLVAVHGVEDWMQDLSPHTAASAAAFRAARSSRRLQRTWRSFASQRKTTAQLAHSFAALGVAGIDYSSAEASVPLLASPPHAQKPPRSPPPAGAGAAADAGAAPPSPSVVLIGGMSGVNSPHHARFEDFAAKLQSADTLRAAQALLRRLEQRLAVRGAATDGAQSLLRQLSPAAPAGRRLDRYPVRVMLCAYMIKEHPEVVFSNVGNVEARLSAAAHQMLAAFEALLARLVQPASSSTASASIAATDAAIAAAIAAAAAPCPSPLTKSMASYVREGRVGPRSAAAKTGLPAARKLFASGSGGAEAAAPAVASAVAPAVAVAAPPVPVSVRPPSAGALVRPGSARGSGGSSSLATLLVAFDDSWLEYLDQFVVWKGHDAAALEVELMRMAVRLERSMRMKLGRRELGSPEVTGNPDLQAMINQVSHDHALLADRIARLTGAEGQARLAAALEHVRQQVTAELAAEEAAASAAAEGSDAGWETASDSGAAPTSRSRSLLRASSRASSLQDPLSDAEALAAAAQQAGGSPAAAGESDTRAAAEADALSNEQMVWEMLYNPDYALPAAEAEAAWHRAMGKAADEPQALDAADVESLSPEQLTAMVSSRARIIAERAFWDSLVWRFKTAVQGGALPSQLAALLSELGSELSGFVADPLESQQLAEQYTERAVLARLSSRTGQQGGGSNLTALGAMMEQLAQALLRSGSEDRAAEAADATQTLRSRMAQALEAAAAAAQAPAANGADDDAGVAHTAAAPDAAAPLAEALAAGLRLLMTQLKLVKLDAANVRLAGLARAMRERGAVSYLQTKLSAAWALAPAAGDNGAADASPPALTAALVAERLPMTAAWISQVQADMLPQLQMGLQAAGLLLSQEAAAAAVVAGGLSSLELRSGVRASPSAPGAASPGRANSAASSGPASAGAAGSVGIKPGFPVAVDGWQGLVRAGLLALVTSDTPAAGPQLPEVLVFDRVRLHEAQNSMQQLLVTAAGLLIVQQLRQANALPWDAALRAQARRRLLVVLSDPGMKLGHLVTELSQLAGGSSVAPERQVTSMFTTIVNPQAAAFKSIRSAIAATLGAHLLYGRDALAADGGAASACNGLLGRVGAAALAEDVAELGARLAAVAAVNEAVHGQLLAVLAGTSA